MPAGAIESGLVGRDLKSSMRKSRRLDLVFRIDQNIVDSPALLADEMLMALDDRIEMLRASQHQHLEFFVCDQLLQVTINCT